MSNPARCIGVVVATLDRPDWLAVAVESIKTSAAFAAMAGIETKILVVDDTRQGSTTPEACARLGVECVQNPDQADRNSPASARMFGLGQIDTPYTVFFDDDDVMLPRYLRVHLETIEREQADVVYGPFTITDGDLRPGRTHQMLLVELGDMLADHNPVNDHCLVRTTSAEGIWDVDLGIAMPFGAWLELAYRGAKFVRLDEPTYFYRRHDGNMSTAADADPRYQQVRPAMIERYRGQVQARDGSVPGPSVALRGRRAVPSGLKTLARRLK